MFHKSSKLRYICENEQVDTENDDTDNEIKVVNNHIYFYSDVSRSNILKLVNAILTLEYKMISLKNEYSLTEYPKIYIHLQSDGGDAYAGLSAMDAIRSCKVPVVTIVDGFVASAATFILLGGTERKMNSNSHILIHQIRTWFAGKYTDLCDEMENCKNLMDMLKNAYRQNSKIPTKKIDNILKKELYLSPGECLQYNLIDEIL